MRDGAAWVGSLAMAGTGLAALAWAAWTQPRNAQVTPRRPPSGASDPPKTVAPPAPAPAPPVPTRDRAGAAKPGRLVIGADGRFEGGDHDAAADALLALLDEPRGRRRPVVRATALRDTGYRRDDPRGYARLRTGVHRYQRALTVLLNGGVHYSWRWRFEELVDAVLELRSLTLPGRRVGDPWYAWPVDDPGQAVPVWLAPEDSASIVDGWYVPVGQRVERTKGVPVGEPIWLTAVLPRIVWERVAPSVACQQADLAVKDPARIAAVDLSSWVLAPRHPHDVTRLDPSGPDHAVPCPPWEW